MPTGTKKDFWSYVEKTAKCWGWGGAVSSSGYGNVRRNGRNTTAHQFAYELTCGPVPDGMELLHACDNKLCVRIDANHVRVGTHMENVRDCVSKRRHARGESHGLAKLTDEDVARIRESYLCGATQSDLSKVWGVSQPHVSRIVRHVRRGSTA